jgi:hypothetical protein
MQWPLTEWPYDHRLAKIAESGKSTALRRPLAHIGELINYVNVQTTILPFCHSAVNKIWSAQERA